MFLTCWLAGTKKRFREICVRCLGTYCSTVDLVNGYVQWRDVCLCVLESCCLVVGDDIMCRAVRCRYFVRFFLISVIFVLGGGVAFMDAGVFLCPHRSTESKVFITRIVVFTQCSTLVSFFFFSWDTRNESGL